MLPASAVSVSDVGPASVMVGNIVQGNRLASAQGRDMGVVDEESDSARKVFYFSLKTFILKSGVINSFEFACKENKNKTSIGIFKDIKQLGQYYFRL